MDDCDTSACPQLAQQSERCTAQDRSLESGFQPGAFGSFAGRVCANRSEDEGMNGQVFESDGWGQGPQTPTPCPTPPSPLLTPACGANKNRRKSYCPWTEDGRQIRSYARTIFPRGRAVPLRGRFPSIATIPSAITK